MIYTTRTFPKILPATPEETEKRPAFDLILYTVSNKDLHYQIKTFALDQPMSRTEKTKHLLTAKIRSIILSFLKTEEGKSFRKTNIIGKDSPPLSILLDNIPEALYLEQGLKPLPETTPDYLNERPNLVLLDTEPLLPDNSQTYAVKQVLCSRCTNRTCKGCILKNITLN